MRVLRVMRGVGVWVGIGALALGLGAAALTHGMGYSARAVPSSIEDAAMRAARRWGTPAAIRARMNPVPATEDVIRAGMEHWADHCATCHANDGHGTPMGRSLYPPAPDMREPPTQHMSDGELFYVIEHGIPLTGMPAWGNETPAGEEASWVLVRFVRRLPHLTEAEIAQMEKLNPKSAADLERERHIRDFLNGKEDR